MVVVLPIAAVVWKSTGNGWSGFWDVVSSPQAVAALKLSVITATLAALTTAVFGTIIAWVIVRDSFAGKLNAWRDAVRGSPDAAIAGAESVGAPGSRFTGPPS